MIQVNSVIQSNRRKLFRGLLIMSLATGCTAVRADQPVKLPPSIVGDARPVLVLGGFEAPRMQTPTAAASQPVAASGKAVVATQHFVKQESTAPTTATQAQPPNSIPAVLIQPAIAAAQPAVANGEEAVAIVNQAAGEQIQRKPSQPPTASTGQGQLPPQPAVVEQNRQPVIQANPRIDRVQAVPRPQQDRGPDNRGPDNRGPDNRGPDNRGPDNRGPDNRGPDNRGPDNRGPNRQGPQWRPTNQVGGPVGSMLFVPEDQSARPMVLQGIGAPGMDPTLHLTRPTSDPDKLLETPVVKKLLELMEQNIELKAQLKIQKVEMDARERVRELESALRSKEERAHHASEELQSKHRHLEQQHNELKEMERKLDQQRKAIEQQHDALSRKTQSNHQVEAKVIRLGEPDANVLQQKRIEVHVVDKGESENDHQSQTINTKLAAELKSMAEKLAKTEAAYKEAATSKEGLTKRLADLENRSRLLEEKAKSLVEQKSGDSDNERSMAEKRLKEREQQARQKEMERDQQAKARAEEERKRAEAKQQEAQANEAAKQLEQKRKEEAKTEADRKDEMRKKDGEKKDKKKDRDDE